MKIDQIEVYYVALPLIYPWRTAYGEDPDIHSVLIKMVSGDQTGWGETTPFRMPTYSPESAMSVYYNISEFLALLLVGKEIESPEALLDCYKFIKGNPFTKAGPEIAWWNLNNFTYPGDIFPSDVHYRQDINDPEVVLGEDCTYTPSRVPGTPYEPVMERVKTVSLHSKTIRPEQTLT